MEPEILDYDKVKDNNVDPRFLSGATRVKCYRFNASLGGKWICPIVPEIHDAMNELLRKGGIADQRVFYLEPSVFKRLVKEESSY